MKNIFNHAESWSVNADKSPNIQLMSKEIRCYCNLTVANFIIKSASFCSIIRRCYSTVKMLVELTAALPTRGWFSFVLQLPFDFFFNPFVKELWFWPANIIPALFCCWEIFGRGDLDGWQISGANGKGEHYKAKINRETKTISTCDGT